VGRHGVGVCQDARVTALPAALATLALAALIAVAGYAATPLLLAAAVALAVLLLAVGWAGLLDLPAPRGSAVVIVLTGWAAAGLAVRAADMTRPLAPFAALLALSVLMAFAHELARRGGRHDLVESVTGTLSGQALALLGGGWVLVPTTRLALTALSTAIAAAAVTRLAATVPMPVPPAFAGWSALGVGAVVGATTGGLLEGSRFPSLLLVSVVVAAVVAGLDRLVLPLAERRPLPVALSAGAAPLLAVGTAAYAVARLVA
jgi:hypothetical protein